MAFIPHEKVAPSQDMCVCVCVCTSKEYTPDAFHDDTINLLSLRQLRI